MAKHVLNSAVITLSSRDLSDYVESVELLTGQGNVSVTAMQDAWEDYLPTGLKRWSVKLNLYQDYGSSAVYVVLNEIINGTTAVPVTLKPTTAIQGATNPTFSGNAVLDGDVSVLGGAVADAHKASVTLKGAGTLNFYTSST